MGIGWLVIRTSVPQKQSNRDHGGTVVLCNTEVATVRGRQNFGPPHQSKDLCGSAWARGASPKLGSAPGGCSPCICFPHHLGRPITHGALPSGAVRPAARTSQPCRCSDSSAVTWHTLPGLHTASAAAASVCPYGPSQHCWVPTENKSELQTATREESLESYMRGTLMEVADLKDVLQLPYRPVLVDAPSRAAPKPLWSNSPSFI